MSILVESLKRLFKNEQITLNKLNDMLAEKKLSQDEYNYIINK